MRPVWAWLAAVASGFVLWTSFAPLGWGWSAVPGCMLLIAATIRQPLVIAFLRAFVGGAVFFLLLLTWLMVVGQDAWVLLSVVCAIFVGLMG
ncbi:MAG: hypothetical protein PHU75_11810, partial [Candidatus Nanopelagicales bacterium]|nr:hypothetical protein [Candidatus Nanopelagicales bacterium]